MRIIPAEAIERIKSVHGTTGELFINGLQEKLNKYTYEWELSDCEFYKYSQNLIFTCKSKKYGDAIIKAAVPGELFLTEMSALKYYSGNNRLCKLYEYSPEDGFALIERFMPGLTLIDVISGPFERADVFIDLFKGFNLPCDDTDTYPTTISLMEAFGSNLEKDNNFIKYKDIQAEIYNKINDEYSRKCLLHGDLNHRNILLDKDTFKIIDPNGIIGDPVFEIARYLLNELTFAIKSDALFNEDIAAHIGVSLGLSIDVLYGLLLFDAIETAAWRLGTAYTPENYDFNLKRCDMAYRLYKK